MRRYARCGLFVALFVLSLTGLSLSYSNSVSAISASMTVTSDIESDYNWNNYSGSNKLRNSIYPFTLSKQQQTDFATEMIGKVEGREIIPENADILLNHKDYGWAYYGDFFIRFPRGAVAWRCMYSDCSHLELGIRKDVDFADGVWLVGRFTTNSSGNNIISVTYPTQAHMYLPCNTTSTMCIKTGGRMNFYQLQNVPEDKQQLFEENVAYGNQDPPDESTDCDALDVVCHLGRIFIPSEDNYLALGFESLKEKMEEKLGFLTFPFEFIGGLSNAINTGLGYYSDDYDCSGLAHTPEMQPLPSCGVCIDNFMGSAPICLRPQALKSAFPALWDMGVGVIRVVAIGGLLEMLRRKYLEVTRQ